MAKVNWTVFRWIRALAGVAIFALLVIGTWIQALVLAFVVLVFGMSRRNLQRPGGRKG